ncbi:MAG: sensor c-di-GMP phosphodiesterase-like protein, partial [Reinekea sp.]
MSLRTPTWMRTIAAVIALVGFMLGFGLATYVLLSTFKNVHDEYADNLMTEAEGVVVEIATILKQLNELNIAQCNQENMLAMRRSLFLSNHVREIGYLNNNNKLICTTGLGVLDEPFSSDGSDFFTENGFEIWIAQPLKMFNQEYKALIAKSGNYNAVYDLNRIKSIGLDGFDWQLIYRQGEMTSPITGSKETFRHLFQEDGHDFSLLEQYSEYCMISNPRYCIAIESRYPVFFEHYRSLIFVVLILLLSLTFINFSVALVLLKRFYSLNSLVKRGIRRDQFFSLYQPIVKLITGEIVGCEALARYKGRKSELFPDQFIPVIRSLKLTWLFTEKIIRKALLDLESNADLPDGFHVNFNIFPSDISSGRIQKLMNIHEVRNTRFHLVFEVTEDEELEEKESKSQLEWLNKQGFSIAVDDFGTGYSSLNQVKNMHCQILKIDRSFVMDMEEGSI